MTQTLAQTLIPGDPIIVIFKEALTFRRADNAFNIQGTSYQTINQWDIITGHLLSLDDEHVYFECKHSEVTAEVKAPLSSIIVRKIKPENVYTYSGSQNESQVDSLSLAESTP
ncbi:MAG: hypothetical protein RBJ76_13295 [Stenomitos frigidus ULC029]